MFNVLFLSRWKPFDGTKGHKHPEYKRIKQLKKSFENQKELENHLKTCRTLKNQKIESENSTFFVVCANLRSQNLDLKASKCTFARCAILSDRTRQEIQDPDPTWYNPHPLKRDVVI